MYDTHAHLQFKDFDQDRDIIIKESKEQGLKGIINIGIDYKTSLEALRLAKKYKDFCFAAVGIHPINVHKDGFDKLEFLKLAKMPEVVAIGEIGLDYYHSDKYKNKQKIILKEQLDLALELDLPVIFHCRGSQESPLSAYQDLFDILKNYSNDLKGVVHCYSGNLDLAKKFINKGFYIGIDGPITFKNAWERLIKTAKNIPLKKILVETDCPYLTPEPYRGKRNKPWYVKFILEKIANLREEDLEFTTKAINENSKNLFKI